MAGSIWLKVPDCEGEATDDGHKKEIDIHSWSWGVAHPVSPFGTGGSGGEATVHDISVTKQIDKATPNLMKFCLNGKHLDEVLLTARKRGEDTIDFVKIKLKKAMISSVQPSGVDGGGASESVSINCEAVEFEYTPQGSDGKPQGAVTMKWNLKENKEG